MQVLQISFFLDPAHRPPAKLLTEWHSLADLASAVAQAGLSVSVVQASHIPDRIHHSGVDFHFLVPDRSVGLTGTAAFRGLLENLKPDVIHVHGLGFPHDVVGLRALVPNTPILLQDHANGVPSFWKRAAWRRGAAAATGISFCAKAQAQPFLDAGLLASDMHIFEIAESTSRFTPGDQNSARTVTGLHGNPGLLWVAHLDANKDPLTVLAGISQAAQHLPNLQLWCCYGSAPLLKRVQSRIDRDDRLRDRVHMVGRVAHREIEQWMRAADMFVLGSHREGGSFALIEALATGLTPVVTDIPSSRVLIGDGKVGALWTCGDADELASALVDTSSGIDADSKTTVRSYFEAELSHAAIGRKFASAYDVVIQRSAQRPARVGS